MAERCFRAWKNADNRTVDGRDAQRRRSPDHKIDGNGPIGIVIADGNAKGEVRGYVSNPHVHFSKAGSLDEVTTLGYNGYIDVIKDLKLKDFYSSTIPLQTGDLAKDFTYYFAYSEQTPTLTSLGTVIGEDNACKLCGGIIIN